MKLWPAALFFLLMTNSVYASGPTLPNQYRMPTEEELSGEWRKGDADKYATVAADFNGDGLIDGAFLVVDEKQKKLVLMAVLINKDFSETWLKLQNMDLAALKYQGVALINPSAVTLYKGAVSENNKQAKTLKFNSIKSFSSEGPSSVFFWDSAKQRFQQFWLTK
jgi:hypothetical protein